MSQFSLNPRGSALSSHSLSVMRPLLRVIAYEKCVSAGATEGLYIDGEELSELEVENETVTKRLDEMAISLQQRADAVYANVPAATALSEDKIAEAIADGNDPYAAAIGCSTATPVHGPPMRLLATAAQFATLLDSSETMAGMIAPRSGSHVIYSQPNDLKALAKALQKTFVLIAQTTEADHDRWHHLQLHFDPSKDLTVKRFASERYESYIDGVRDAVRHGAAFIVLTEPSEPLPEVARAVCDGTLLLPGLSRQHVMEIMRVTHSNTGQLAEDAVLQNLPSDRELAVLPLDVVEGAFQENSTIKVAQALSIAVKRLRQSTDVTLEDIVLPPTVAAPARQLVDDVKAWDAGELRWDDVSSSILLFGPPGNGKTLLASALAGSLGAPLVATSYSDCQKFGHKGDMLKALSDKVTQAISNAPCVFFLDELDSFSERDRPARFSNYMLGVVNGLLEHLTRLNDTPGVIVLAATNHPHLVDPAVIRPGRFDNHLELGNPDRKAISEILKHALGPISEELNLAAISDQLLGSSGAQVAALVRSAKGIARREKSPLCQEHLQAAVNHVAPNFAPDILRRMAVHEAGHIVVSAVLKLPEATKGAITREGGYVDVPTSLLECRASADSRVAALLAGRAAEKAILGDVKNGAGLGAASDLALATKLVFMAHFEWGLGKSLFSAKSGLASANLDADTVQFIDEELHRGEATALKIIVENLQAVERVADAFMVERELDADQLRTLLEEAKIEALEPSIASTGGPG